MNSPNRIQARRKSKGRQKVSMAKMENHSNLQVTFSKRRAGLFKKASELCTLCGAETALVVFSPANKVYCFGHPGLQAIVDRFFSDAAPVPTNGTSRIIEAHRNSTIRELNLELTQVESMLRAEKSRSEKLDLKKREGKMQHWFPPSFDRFKLDQLCVMKENILELTKKLDVKVEREMFRLANPLPLYPPPFQRENENPNPRVFGFPFNLEPPNVPPLQKKNENSRVFGFPFSTVEPPNVPPLQKENENSRVFGFPFSVEPPNVPPLQKENENSRVFGFPFNVEPPNVPPLQKENENSRVFGFPFSVEPPNGPRGPTFNDQFSLGTSNLSPFGHRAIGVNNTNNYDLFPSAGAPTQPTDDLLMMTGGGTGLASFDHRKAPQVSSAGEGYGLMSSGNLGGSLFLDGNNSTIDHSTSMLHFDPNGRGFGDGFGTGYGSSMF